MIKLVTADWLAAQLGNPELTILDPRRPMKHLLGHLPGALNLPVYQCFGLDGALLDPPALTALLGDHGVSDRATVALYDSPEGQNAAMLAWLLEYLGMPEIHLMADFFETWKAAGREIRYRPVAVKKTSFTPRLNPSVRVTLAEARAAVGLRFIDFRSREEFTGERAVADDVPGHIPGAINLVWRDLATPGVGLKSLAALQPLLAQTGLQRSDRIVAYCRSGPRAALGYVALRQAGFAARLFDASWAQWSKHGLPAEK